ncbi:O-antigen ligase domain-containing protein [Sporolactobacillus sp. THM7-4]|nr:O-antigen ligase domain-containing protein [Sporolactobacillus sp. THM7-4]
MKDYLGGIMMASQIQEIKKNPIAAGLVVLFILPPLGMLWFVILGISEWLDVKNKREMPTDMVSMLFILMMLASAGATMINLQPDYLLSTLMIGGYLSIYLYFLHHPDYLHLRQYLWITIFGGIYIYFSEKIFDLFSFTSPAGKVVALMTGHFLFGYMKHDRLFGSAFNPNYACYLLILALSFLLVEFLRAIRFRDNKRISVSLILLAILDLGIYETGSRAGFVIMLLLHLLFLFKWNKRWFITAAVATVLFSPSIYQWMPRSDDTGVSMDKRLEIWKTSLHIIAEHPVFGATSFGFRDDYVRLTGHAIPHAHDLFLAVFSISGVICGLFFIAIVMISGYRLIRLQMKAGNNSYYADLFLFSLPTIIAYGLMDFELSSPQILIIVFGLLSFWSRYMKRMRGVAPSYHFQMKYSAKRRQVPGERRSKATSIHSLKDSL